MDKTVIESYINGTDWRKNENANETYSISGLAGHLARTAIAKYALDNVYTPEIKAAHLDGRFYIHDLGLGLEGYCVGLDLRELLIEGLHGVPTKTASSPPAHFRTALGQIVNWIFLISQEVAGAVAISSLDTFLAPFVYADGLTYEEVYQSMQEFVYNINQSTRIAFQTPFSNITMDLIANGPMASEKVVIAGMDYIMYSGKDSATTNYYATYGMFQKEMDMINKAFAEVMTKGDSEGRVFTFPIPTYNLTKNFDWDNPRLDPIWKMTARYGIPYFANFVNSDMEPEDVRSMCCRLRIDTTQLARRGGLFSSNPTTGSVGVVTINMPHLAYTYRGNPLMLESGLFEIMDLAAETLQIKRKIVEENTERGLYPYMERSLRHVKENLGSYWANHFNSIGLIGMAEFVEIWNPLAHGIQTEAGQKLAASVLDAMLKHLKTLQEKYGVMFNLEATPAETASYVLAKEDLKLFNPKTSEFAATMGPIVHRGTEEYPYYTNSALPTVDFTDDLWEYLDVTDNLLPKFTGGSVVHVWLGEALPDEGSVKELVKTIATNYKVPYFSITPSFSICPIHGYISGVHEYCPVCDAEIIAQGGKLDEN